MTATTRKLSRPPGSLRLMLRAGLPLIPGASSLPFIAGGGSEVPDTELTLRGARLDAERLASYVRVCGFSPGATLPATAPHLLAFPLHMALMTDPAFPFPAVGLVHVANRIELHRAIGADEPLDLRVRCTPLEPHPRGRTFAIITEARAGEELVWEERSTMLRRGSASESGGGTSVEQAGAAAPPAEGVAEWRLPEDLGRRYGSVSGDRNPIHMHALSARLFGFPRAIAHGMWTKARCLAELGYTLPPSCAVEVAFRKPIFLPGHVSFARSEAGERTRFAVRAAGDQANIHLEGTVTR